MLIFIPQIIKSLGVTNTMTVGWLTMIPSGVSAVAELAWGQVSDRMNERRWNLSAGCMLSALGASCRIPDAESVKEQPIHIGSHYCMCSCINLICCSVF